MNPKTPKNPKFQTAAGDVQIVIRSPQADLAQARKLAERKRLGYQALPKILVHEGLAREAWRDRAAR